MTHHKDPLTAKTRREAAEARLVQAVASAAMVPVRSADELVHELQVHKIELEMQNDELRAAQVLLEISRDRYADLYEFAPVGYFTVAANGMILDANLTGAEYLGVARANLVNFGFARFVAPTDQECWATHMIRVLQSEDKQACELGLRRRDGSEFTGRLDSVRISLGQDAHPAYTLRIALSDIPELKQAERERTAAAERLSQLSRRLASVQEEERKNLSARLHDRTSPNLAALKLNLVLIAKALEAAPSPALAALLADTRALLDDTTISIRDISADLRPPVLDFAGLLAAIEGYADQIHRRTGVAVIVDGSRFHRRPPPEQETLLYRIASEALTNCAKHAHAGTIRILLANENSHVLLSIRDDGVGFDESALAASGKARGIGLISMRERAEFAGGSFHLDSAPGQGTRIEARI